MQNFFATINNYLNKVVSKIIETERIQTVITLNKKDQPLKNNETHAPVCWTKRRIDDEENEESRHRCAQQPKQQRASYLQHQKLTSKFPVKDKFQTNKQLICNSAMLF